MNIKERLKETKKTPVGNSSQKINDCNQDVSGVFSDGKYVKNLVRNYIKHLKNIVFITTPSFDNLLISRYFKSFTVKSMKAEISNVIGASESKVNIIPEPTITDIVKIFENIICTDKSYIWGFKINSYSNMLDKLKTLIAVNFSNLTSNNIDILIGSSDTAIVYFSVNEDGLYYISKIEELNNIEGSLKIEKIYDCESAFVLSDDNQKDKADEKKSEIDSENDIKNETDSINETEDFSQSESEQNFLDDILAQNDEITSSIVVNNNMPKKVNKYKILREKLRSRRISFE